MTTLYRARRMAQAATYFSSVCQRRFTAPVSPSVCLATERAGRCQASFVPTGTIDSAGGRSLWLRQRRPPPSVQRFQRLSRRAQSGTGQVEADPEAEGLESLEDSVPSTCDAAGTTWGAAALAVAREVLCSTPGLEGLEIFSFRAIPSSKTIDVRLDNLADKFGSPTLDDIEVFSRAFNEKLGKALGDEEAGSIAVEVSSPGAERQIRVPGDLERFRELPMKVEWTRQDGRSGHVEKVLSFTELDGAATRWRLADVKANRTGKGRGLNRQQRDQVFEIPLGDLLGVRLHLDV